jgi:hypothetical protein
MLESQQACLHVSNLNPLLLPRPRRKTGALQALRRYIPYSIKPINPTPAGEGSHVYMDSPGKYLTTLSHHYYLSNRRAFTESQCIFPFNPLFYALSCHCRCTALQIASLSWVLGSG